MTPREQGSRCDQSRDSRPDAHRSGGIPRPVSMSGRTPTSSRIWGSCILSPFFVPVQQLARPSEEVLERFHVDTRYLGAHGPESFPGGVEQNIREGRLWHDLRDEFGVVWSMPDDQGLYSDITHHPLAGRHHQGCGTLPLSQRRRSHPLHRSAGTCAPYA